MCERFGYNAKEVEDSIIKVSEKVAGQGYAFARVEPRGDRNFQNHTISVTYAIDQGPRAYVERIEIRGNEKPRDFVIRREFDVSESLWKRGQASASWCGVACAWGGL